MVPVINLFSFSYSRSSAVPRNERVWQKTIPTAVPAARRWCLELITVFHCVTSRNTPITRACTAWCYQKRRSILLISCTVISNIPRIGKKLFIFIPENWVPCPATYDTWLPSCHTTDYYVIKWCHFFFVCCALSKPRALLICTVSAFVFCYVPIRLILTKHYRTLQAILPSMTLLHTP